MSDWKAKRFWKIATVTEADNGFTVLLDTRPVKTPAKAPLVVPTHSMASAIAAEWDAQDGLIKPLTMPVTRGANAAIDKVAVQREEVIDMLAAYGGSDLLCYRAAAPESLTLRQSENWDPLLAWAATRFGAKLLCQVGVMPIEQPASSLAPMRAELARLSDFELAAAHDLISLSGSLVLAHAVIEKRLTPPEAWLLSRIDEHWQAEQWGADDDATALETIKRAAFEQAAAFYDMCSA